jgi:lysozyme family protein
MPIYPELKVLSAYKAPTPTKSRRSVPWFGYLKVIQQLTSCNKHGFRYDGQKLRDICRRLPATNPQFCWHDASKVFGQGQRSAVESQRRVRCSSWSLLIVLLELTVQNSLVVSFHLASSSVTIMQTGTATPISKIPCKVSQSEENLWFLNEAHS